MQAGACLIGRRPQTAPGRVLGERFERRELVCSTRARPVGIKIRLSWGAASYPKNGSHFRQTVKRASHKTKNHVPYLIQSLQSLVFLPGHIGSPWVGVNLVDTAQIEDPSYITIVLPMFPYESSLSSTFSTLRGSGKLFVSKSTLATRGPILNSAVSRDFCCWQAQSRR
jgi:hypothetical protein